jgi:hypothetical protein
LSPTRRALFADLLSELCFQAEFERLNRTQSLRLHEEAWAHDVTNWTRPISNDLDTALRNLGPEQNIAFQAIKRSRLNALLLNTSATARQQIIVGHVQHPGRFFSLTRSREARQIVELVLQILLNIRADNLRGAKIIWPNRLTLDEATTALARLLGVADGGRFGPQLGLFTEGKVLWPIAFLREVVQNIRINNPVKGKETITLDFITRIQNAELHLEITQTQVEAKPWRTDIVPGLEKANQLYGARGSGTGMIMRSDVKRKRLSKREWSIVYTVLIVFFFRGGESG